jgi:hypothetical protein
MRQRYENAEVAREAVHEAASLRGTRVEPVAALVVAAVEGAIVPRRAPLGPLLEDVIASALLRSIPSRQ